MNDLPRRERVSSRLLDGHVIHIVDGLFDEATVRLLHESMMRLPFTLDEADTEETRHVLHWKCDLDPQAMAGNPILRFWRSGIERKVMELTGATGLGVRRIYCNNVHYGAHQHVHDDSREGVTALYFVNAEWIENWQGETIFYTSDGEPHHAVAPRPGRLVVFPAPCLHRGGVPAKPCLVPRLTVAFKFTEDR